MKNPTEGGLITREGHGVTREGYGGLILHGNETSVISQGFDTTSIETHGG